MDATQKHLGEVIKNLRLERQQTQQVLADRSGLRRAHIGAIERGEKDITVSTAKKLAEGLGVRLSAIFARVEALSHESGDRDAFKQDEDHS
jgi:transcriptional regulator with XRE-family HTH domain